MKNAWKIGLALLALFSFTACTNDTVEEPNTATVALSDTEISDLKFLREEEKLALDVYTLAYEEHRLNVFSNIAAAEQRHTDMVKELLDKYNVPDPAEGKGFGEFTNPELQTLFTTLTQKVTQSLENALAVGATIEDLDIADIQALYAHTEKGDITQVYNSLQCASKNHMRAFYGQLEQRNIEYTPQYITQAELDAILKGAHQHCGQ